MTRYFADTSFYLALINPRDAWHEPARVFTQDYHGALVTSEFVIVELGALMSRGGLRMLFGELVRTLEADPDTEIIRLSSGLLTDGMELFHQRPDKDWSLVDCTSFVIMQRQNLSTALTTDHHFEQAGFLRSLGPPRQ